MNYLKIAGVTGGTNHPRYPGWFQCEEFILTSPRTAEEPYWLIVLIVDDAHTAGIRSLQQSGKSVPDLHLVDQGGYELVFEDVRCTAAEYRGRHERGTWYRYDFIAKKKRLG